MYCALIEFYLVKEYVAIAGPVGETGAIWDTFFYVAIFLKEELRKNKTIGVIPRHFYIW